MSAYILAKIEAGKDEEVISRIKEMKEIRNAIITYGVYDLIVNVDFERIEDLDNFVFNVLRRIPGIKETMTMVAVKSIV